MTKLHYIKGNLFSCKEPVILHGCNAQGRMGAGIAKLVKEKFPIAYEEYHNFCKIRKPQCLLGEVIFVDCGNKIIANAITQEKYGTEPKQYVDYRAVESAMFKIEVYARILGIESIAMPKIGAGLGGGNWDTIEKIIEKMLVRTTPVVYVA